MDAKPTDDADLLREFAASHSQLAFRTVVERYQDMVFGTARRRLGDDQSAFDVAQNVFTALAKKAPWLSARSSVGGWLYKSTLMEAARRQRDDLRRYKRERRYAEEMNIRGTNDDVEDEPQLKTLTPVLDDALNRLSESDREAILLRFFRGLSLRDTGVALGTTEEAARKRVSRALDRLNSIFKRKGVVMPTALLMTAALPKMAAQAAAPAGFAAKVTAAAAASTSTGLLGVGFLKLAALSKMQIAATCLVGTTAPMVYQATKIVSLQNERAALESKVDGLGKVNQKSIVVSSRAMPPDTLAAAGRTSADPQKSSGAARTDWSKWKALRELESKYQKEARLTAVANRLKLSDEQRGIVGAAFDKTSAERKALWDGGTPPDRSAGDAIRKEQDDTIAGVLDETQLQPYREFAAEEEQNRQEIYAARLLSEMQNFLHLNADQKDKLWRVFTEQAAQAEGDPSPWAWSQTIDDGRDVALRVILDERQYKFWEQRVNALKASMNDSMRRDRPLAPPPPPPPALGK